MVPFNSGPMAGCNVHVNGNCADPNLQPGRSAGSGPFITIPKEIHTLNDAILAAAKELSTRPKGRRRIIYVVSDGKEYGSKATYRDVLRYLADQQHRGVGHAGGRFGPLGRGLSSAVSTCPSRCMTTCWPSTSLPPAANPTPSAA